MKTVIVGGVAAGASTGARLRRLDESAEIVILERGRYVSFANCGLPTTSAARSRTATACCSRRPRACRVSLALDVRTGHEVVCIDPTAKEVEVHDIDDGPNLPRDLRQAGAVPRGGAHPAAHSRAPTTRASTCCATSPTWIASSPSSTPGATSAVVIGGSYIGLEMTEALRTRGLENRRSSSARTD